MVSESPPVQRGGVAFLLAQLGAYAGEQFGIAIAEVGLTPPLVGILRLLQSEPGLSQQGLADRLGMVPSRVVGYVDDLESRGWVSRARDKEDRRVNVLTVTDAGREAFKSIGKVARDHDRRMTTGLDDADYGALRDLLSKVAAAQELTPGVHPGYRAL